MITDTEVKQFHQIPGGTLACVIDDSTYLIHNKWMVLALPGAQIEVTKVWAGNVQPDVRLWRYTQLPEGEGESAMVFRGSEKIRLSSDSTEAFIQPDVHDLLITILDKSPEYHLFPGEREDGSPNAIAVAVDGKIVGALAPYVDEVQEGWLTV